VNIVKYCSSCLKNDVCTFQNDLATAEEEIKIINEKYSLKPIEFYFRCNSFYEGKISKW
jgi:hypothetical protein